MTISAKLFKHGEKVSLKDSLLVPIINLYVIHIVCKATKSACGGDGSGRMGPKNTVFSLRKPLALSYVKLEVDVD